MTIALQILQEAQSSFFRLNSAGGNWSTGSPGGGAKTPGFIGKLGGIWSTSPSSRPLRIHNREGGIWSNGASSTDSKGLMHGFEARNVYFHFDLRARDSHKPSQGGQEKGESGATHRGNLEHRAFEPSIWALALGGFCSILLIPRGNLKYQLTQAKGNLEHYPKFLGGIWRPYCELGGI